MKMYFHDLRSNRLMTPSPRATHPKPARKPAVAPQAAVVLGSARNRARLAAMSSEKMNEKPKILPVLPFCRSGSVNQHSAIQERPKRAGEYHSPPRTKVEIAAATTASQFTLS